MKVFISDDSKVIKESFFNTLSEFEEIKIVAQEKSANEAIESLC